MSARLMARMLSKRSRVAGAASSTAEAPAASEAPAAGDAPLTGETPAAAQPEAFSVDPTLETDKLKAAMEDSAFVSVLPGSPAQERRQYAADAQKILDGVSIADDSFFQTQQLEASSDRASSEDSCAGLALSDAPELTHGWSLLDAEEEAARAAITMDDSRVSVASQCSSVEGHAFFDETTMFDAGSASLGHGLDASQSSMMGHASSFDAEILSEKVAAGVVRGSLLDGVLQACQLTVDGVFDPPRAVASPPAEVAEVMEVAKVAEVAETAPAAVAPVAAVQTPAKASVLTRVQAGAEAPAPETPDTVREARSALGLRTDLPKPRRRRAAPSHQATPAPKTLRAAPAQKSQVKPHVKVEKEATAAPAPRARAAARKELGKTLPPPKPRRTSSGQRTPSPKAVAARKEQTNAAVTMAKSATKAKSPKPYVVD